MSIKTEVVVPFSPVETDQSDHAYVMRWKHAALFGKGYLVVPNLFLRYYAHLKPFPLNTGEALFVLHLMEYKWDSEDPFPGYKTLAKRMGISDKMARRHAQSLEIKKYLRRKMRIGQTNRFDLTPLFDALKNAIEQDQQKN
jgi:Helix-turn-helix domain